jgi:lipopolysaccharide export system permease protein
MMPIMGRYLGRSIVGFTLLVMALLMILLAVYLFANEQSDVGVGSYTMNDAFWFTLLNLPRSLFDLLPIGALIGSLFALANFARSSELTVMRAAGVSVARIGVWAGTTGIVMAIATWIIGDYVAPPLERIAQEQKTFAKYKQISLTGNQTAWAKDGDTFISVQQQTTENQFGGVYVFRFDSDHRLLSVGRANDVRASDKLLELRDYAESVIQPPNASDPEAPAVGESVIPSHVATQTLVTNLTPEFLGLVASSEPATLPGSVLVSVIRHYRANGLDARAFETALWARIARTTALVFMVVLAVPFALGISPRSGSGGVRTVLGVLVGAGFFLLAKLMESGALVFDLSPWAVAWTPTLLLAAVVGVALARAR